MQQQRWRLGDVELDKASFCLRRCGQELKLDRKPMELLLLLAERGGAVVSHDEALRLVWGEGVFVDGESALYTAVKKIRRALGQADRVQTVSGRGYRLRLDAELAHEANGERSAGRDTVNTTLERIAILPLTNLSPDPDQQYFSDGLTEELIGTTARLLRGRMLVIARTSVMRFKGVSRPASEIGHELGATYLVEGSVRREQERVRVTIHLLRAADGTCQWSEVFDRAVDAMLPLQAEIAMVTASALFTNIAPIGRAVAHSTPPEVHDLYLRARFLWAQRTKPTIQAAIRTFRGALAKDEHHAPSYAGLSCCYALLPITSLANPSECFGQARELAERAISLDASQHEAHIALGLKAFWFERQWSEAFLRFRTAAALNPADSAAPMFIAHVHSVLREHDEALEMIRTAQQSDPLSPIVGTHVGHFLYNAQRYREAVQELDRVLEVHPQFWVAHLMRGKALASTGQTELALQAFSASNENAMGNTEALSFSVFTLCQAGRRLEAEALWQQLERLHQQAAVPPMHRALARLGMGDRAGATRITEEAFDEHDVRLIFAAVETRWQRLGRRAHTALLRRVGLPVGDSRVEHQPTLHDLR